MKVVFTRVAAQLPSQNRLLEGKSNQKPPKMCLIPTIDNMQVCTIRVTESAAAARSFEQVVHTAVHELSVLGTNEAFNLGSTESTHL